MMPVLTLWDATVWGAFLLFGMVVFRTMANAEARAGRKGSAQFGRRIAFGFALAGFCMMTVGVLWAEPKGFTMIGVMGVLSLVLGGLNVRTVMRGGKPWL